MVWNRVLNSVVSFAMCLLAVGVVAHAAEKSGNKPFDVGVRLGTQISNIMTDANWGPYPDISGPGGMFSFDISRGITSHLYLHTALALDYRTFYAYSEIGIPCVALEGEEPCGGYWEGYDRKSLLYLEVPVMARWKTSALFFEVGPVVDVMLYSGDEYILPKKHRGGSNECYEDRLLVLALAGAFALGGLFLEPFFVFA